MPSPIAAPATYSFNAVELRAELASPHSLNLFASLLLGPTFKHEFPEAHQAYWALLVNAALSSEQELRYALGLPRGFAKTTLIKLFCCWLLVNTDFRFILVVSARADLAQKVIGDICDMLDTENFRALYGNWRTEIERDALDQKVFKFQGKNCVLYSLGAEGAVRGLNIKNQRPDVIIAEDAQTRECALSPTQNQGFIEWFLGTLYLARSYERSLTIWIGNMYPGDCMLNLLRKSPDWVSLISAGMLASGQSLWPAFRTKESLLADYRQAVSFRKANIFLSEVMNDPDSGNTDFFDAAAIKPYTYALNEPAHAAYLVIDPATGKKDGDNTAIMLAYVYDGKPVCRDLRSGKWGDEATIEQAIEMCAEHPVSLICIEAVAYQISLAFQFERVFAQRGITGIRIQPISPHGVPKAVRIKNFLHRWASQEEDVHPSIAPILLMQAQRYNPLRKDNEDDELDVAAYVNPALGEYWHMLQNSMLDPQEVYGSSVPSKYVTNCF